MKFTRRSRNNLIVISFSMECPEAVERGRNFRLLAEEELSQLLDFLTGYLPESLKVRTIVPRSRLYDPFLQSRRTCKFKCLPMLATHQHRVQI